MRAPLCLLGLLLVSCSVPTTVARLGDHSPPPEFGRPGWVKAFAAVGAWTGGVVGGIASIVVLPVTYPISLLAGDDLGPGGEAEFLLFPASGGAAFGHALFGCPPDVVDYVFRRAWVGGEDPTNPYEVVPMPEGEVPREGAETKSEG